MDKVFDYIEDTLKNVAKVLFFLCFDGGIFVIVIGCLWFLKGLDGYTTFAEGMACTAVDAIRGDSFAAFYHGKLIVKAGIAMMISSVATLPLYGLGELIDLCTQIKRKLEEQK